MNLSQISRQSEQLVFIGAERRRIPQPGWLHGAFIAIISLESSKWAHSATARHKGGCNLSFADGHCEYWKWKAPDNIGNTFSAPYEDALRLFNVTKGRKY